MSTIPDTQETGATETIKDLLEQADSEYAGDELTVDSGETYTIESGETQRVGHTVDNSGTVNNSGTLSTGDDSTIWTLEKPEIYLQQEIAQADRGPGDGQPPEIYLFEPLSAELSSIDAKMSRFNERRTVIAVVYTLNSPDSHGEEATQYENDIIQFISEYRIDNTDRTDFYEIRPSTVDSRLSEHITRTTDYHVTAVEIELQRQRTPGVGGN